MMTRKHFEAIAEILKARTIEDPAIDTFDDGFATAVAEVAHDLANYFAGENERFDVDRFLTACGVKG